MYVLIYAPQGIVGEDGSKAVLTDTLEGARYEMRRQVDEYIKEWGLEPDDCSIDLNQNYNHATADLSDECAPEWHIYEV